MGNLVQKVVVFIKEANRVKKEMYHSLRDSTPPVGQLGIHRWDILIYERPINARKRNSKLNTIKYWQPAEGSRCKCDELSWIFHLFLYLFIIYWFIFIFLYLKDQKRRKEIKWTTGTNIEISFSPIANFAKEGSRLAFVYWNWAAAISGVSTLSSSP